jgi:hypothetical protein
MSKVTSLSLLGVEIHLEAWDRNRDEVIDENLRIGPFENEEARIHWEDRLHAVNPQTLLPALEWVGTKRISLHRGARVVSPQHFDVFPKTVIQNVIMEALLAGRVKKNFPLPRYKCAPPHTQRD